MFDSALQALAHLASPTPRGTSSVIIGGGGTVEFTVPAGHGGRADTVPSVEAYLISGLVFGADTLAMTFGQIPGAKADPSKAAKAIGLAEANKSCLQSLDELDHHNIDSAQALGELFRTVANYSTGCLADQWKVAYGLTGFIASFAIGVLLWLVDGVKLVIDGLRAAIDTAIYWRSYRIAVSTKAAPVAAVTASTLLNAPVPAMCQHEAGRLVNGSLPGLTDYAGYENLDVQGTPAPGPGGFMPPLFLDVTGDGAGDAAAVIHCSAGGVSWPDQILFYGPGTNLIGQVDLSDVHQAEHANVDSMTAEGHDVRVTWNTTEGCCDDPQNWTALLHWNGSTVVVTQPTRTG